MVGAPVAALADRDVAAGRARSDIFRSQTKVLDQRGSVQYSYSTRLRPESEIGGVDVPFLPTLPAPRYKGEYLPVAQQAARRHGIPESLFLRLVQQESAWNPTARSHKGAIGLAQLMPGTARVLGVNPHDPHQNLDGGARYLRQQYEAFGSWRLALAAYNAGPGAVEKHNGVPPYRETRNYVRKILGSAR
ncbi:MAG: lytic transglycosylase domain-containing protein [Pseudomonadota bacterium]